MINSIELDAKQWISRRKYWFPINETIAISVIKTTLLEYEVAIVANDSPVQIISNYRLLRDALFEAGRLVEREEMKNGMGKV